MAIRIPAEVKERLRSVQAQLDRGPAAISWTRPESIHLTLKFLGEVDDNRIDEIGSALEKAAAGVAPLSLVVEGVGGFPTRKYPRVIWAGIRENAELKKLQLQVEEAISSLGFEPEDRAFSPHLTLCRIKSTADGRKMGGLLAEVQPELKAGFDVSSVVLFKSVLKPAGAEYTALKEIILKG
ncbi:MAG TPA: RNA 2',3'-cyclic phosphodiesterase [Thermodesulfobacteriota bacterium]